MSLTCERMYGTMRDMSSISLQTPIRFETAVEIALDRNELFDYVADPRHFAEWNSAVQSVVPLDRGKTHDGGYVMRRILPGGPAINELLISARRPATLTLRTVSGPTPFIYRYSFEPAGAGTLLTLSAEVWLGGVASVLGPLAAARVMSGVDANFATLRAISQRAA
jgi:hypothetical protein